MTNVSVLRAVMDDAIRQWFLCEDTYRFIKQTHQAANLTNADQLTKNDQKAQKALKDGDWHRDRVQTAALGILAIEAMAQNPKYD